MRRAYLWRLCGVVLLALGLAACQLSLPWQKDAAPPPAAAAGVTAKPGAITGGPISVTPITPGEAPAAKPATPPEPPPPVKSDAQLQCESQGGNWRSAGAAMLRSCVFDTRDSGKSCRRQSDCEGLCLARSRSCAPVKPLFGCNDILQDDGRQVTLCID